MTRPLSTEAGPNGYLGLQRWLARRRHFSRFAARALRRAARRSTPGVTTGNLLITTAPHVYPLRNSEVEPLQELDRGGQHAGGARRAVGYAGVVDGRRHRPGLHRSHESMTGLTFTQIPTASSRRRERGAKGGSKDDAGRRARQATTLLALARLAEPVRIRVRAQRRASAARWRAARSWPFPNFRPCALAGLVGSRRACWSLRAITIAACRRCG